ncbi:hypothetical protein CHL76_02405 [Marinococcus halophilus]|uniref:Uncharacterized protein n=1 Tax=Marinococcus halophilus TaxID=1371 RepID=A0A510Y1I9_MARHA|nr:hypothetical protein [Marinococcus halophilus]OZT81227.1 hypothetical protein CHL76_02405 [Marinococcus halophilus]GEK57166.1 hypothetical protein MHA01_00710 [Marinococcus halophilus]
MKTIYRIENEETMHGMWYRLDGTFDPFINRLTEGISKSLPMDFDERYSKGGRKWFSGCDNREQIQSWFSTKDAIELFKNGYRLFAFKSTQFVEEDVQTIFTREGIVEKHEIPLETLWNVQGAKL